MCDLPLLLDTTVGVFHLRSPLGQYKLTFDKAKEACANEAASMATYNQLSYAQKVGSQLSRYSRQSQQGGGGILEKLEKAQVTGFLEASTGEYCSSSCPESGMYRVSSTVQGVMLVSLLHPWG